MKAIIFLAVLAACTDTRDPIKGTQSLKVELITPSSGGTIDSRLADTLRTVSMKITAIGIDGQPDASFNRPLQVYVHYLGTLTPYIGETPLATVAMAGGTGTLSNFMLPAVYGPTTLWFEDACYTTGIGSGSMSSGCAAGASTYATGSSPTLWFREPFIADLRRPADESVAAAFTDGPVDNKNVTVLASRFGAQGRLVVTSKYAQGYTLADVKCADANGTPPCVYAPQVPPLTPITSGATMLDTGYDSIDVFSYSAPLDQEKRFVSEAQVVDGFSGGVSEFNGLLEIGFPQTFFNQPVPAVCMAGSPTCDPAREPAPIVVDQSWFNNPILFKRYESALLEIDGAAICNLDDKYTTYKEWGIDLSGTGGACTGNIVYVVSTGIFDPTPYVGKKLTKLVAINRSLTTSKHVFIVYPRSMSDIIPQ
jgi:hypothetical protein